MSSGVFRGKESSNRIELSRLVQDLLHFGVLGSLWLWGEGRWVGGVWGHLGAWGCLHMYAHVCMHMYTCIENANGCLTWRHPCLACLSCLTCMCVHVHVCACACMHAWDTCPHTHTDLHPHPPICHPLRGDPRISKSSITLELIKIFQFHLKI